MSVTPQQYLASGESISVNAKPAIDRALATGLPVYFPKDTYVVAWDPSAFYCIKVPSDAVMIFEEGAVIKAKDGLPEWRRVVSFEFATNVHVFGELAVDGNVANISPTNNEHMHGVHMYNTSNCYIEAIRSENCRGDNIFIGGDDNTVGSNNIVIGAIRAKKGLCCITYRTCNYPFTLVCYATRAVIGVPMAEKRLRIAARTLSSVI